MRTLFLVVTFGLLAGSAYSDDPPKKLTPEERKELEAKRVEVSEAGYKAYRSGRMPEAVKAAESAIAIARRLYPTSDYPDGHINLATNLNDLGVVYWRLGNLDGAESILNEALEMRKRLLKGDHLQVAYSLNNLAILNKIQDKPAAAESRLKECLGMKKRLFKGDHMEVLISLNALAVFYVSQEKLTIAESFASDAMLLAARLSGDASEQIAFSKNTLEPIRQLDLTQLQPCWHDGAIRQGG